MYLLVFRRAQFYVPALTIRYDTCQLELWSMFSGFRFLVRGRDVRIVMSDVRIVISDVRSCFACNCFPCLSCVSTLNRQNNEGQGLFRGWLSFSFLRFHVERRVKATGVGSAIVLAGRSFRRLRFFVSTFQITLELEEHDKRLGVARASRIRSLGALMGLVHIDSDLFFGHVEAVGSSAVSILDEEKTKNRVFVWIRPPSMILFPWIKGRFGRVCVSVWQGSHQRSVAGQRPVNDGLRKGF